MRKKQVKMKKSYSDLKTSLMLKSEWLNKKEERQIKFTWKKEQSLL